MGSLALDLSNFKRLTRGFFQRREREIDDQNDVEYASQQRRVFRGYFYFTFTLCHTKLILWMTVLSRKKWSQRTDFFYKKIIERAREEATIFFIKKIISRENGASEEATFFFQRKKRNTDVIFSQGKKIGVPKQKWSGEIKKNVLLKKWSREIYFF